LRLTAEQEAIFTPKEWDVYGYNHLLLRSEERNVVIKISFLG